MPAYPIRLATEPRLFDAKPYTMPILEVISFIAGLNCWVDIPLDEMVSYSEVTSRAIM